MKDVYFGVNRNLNGAIGKDGEVGWRKSLCLTIHTVHGLLVTLWSLDGQRIYRCYSGFGISNSWITHLYGRSLFSLAMSSLIFQTRGLRSCDGDSPPEAMTFIHRLINLDYGLFHRNTF